MYEDVIDEISYFIDDPTTLIESKEGLRIDYKDLNPDGFEQLKAALLDGRESFPYRGIIIVVTPDGSLTFKKKTRDQVKTMLQRRPSAQEAGRKVLEMPELRREIAKFVPDDAKEKIKGLTREREEKADKAASVQRARQSAMKNKGLETFVQNMIDSGVVHRLFWSENPMFKEYNVLDLRALERGTMSVFAPDTVYTEMEFDYDQNDIQKPFEFLQVGAFVETVARKFFFLFGEEDALLSSEDYMRDEGELKTNQVFKEYKIGYGGALNVLEGDDRKFMLVYLKKKFNITEADIQTMITNEAKTFDATRNEMDERNKVKTAKKKSVSEKAAQNAATIGIPKGKANAIVLTAKEIRDKFPDAKLTKYADTDRLSIYLARKNYYLTPVKD